MKTKKITKWEDFKIELYMLKIKCSMLKTSITRSINRFFNCRKGYHCLNKKFIRIEKNMIYYVDIEYLGCKNCDYLFFASDRDKQKLLNYQEKERKKRMGKNN